jgi:LEA14-like dessication related protein
VIVRAARVLRAAGALVLVLLLAGLAAGCASLSSRDPLNVTVAGIESLPGEGMEMRMLVKLRIQNPNDTDIRFDGVALNLDVQGKSFATGVSDEAGTVPRFGEAVVAVPVTVSVLRMMRQVIGVLDGEPVDTVTFALAGKLNGAGAFGTHRFRTAGDFRVPGPAAPDAPL